MPMSGLTILDVAIGGLAAAARRGLGDRRRDEAGAGAGERGGRRLGAERRSSSPSFARS